MDKLLISMKKTLKKMHDKWFSCEVKKSFAQAAIVFHTDIDTI